MRLEPVIKWAGSKRTQAVEIVSRMGDGHDVYYEPFCGGCSVLYHILSVCPDRFRRFVCNDLNSDLIAAFRRIKSSWESLFDSYREMWLDMNRLSDIAGKRRMYEEVRSEFNRTRDPDLFFFIMRTCENGMPRYNSSGEFNTSFHLTRPGMEPKRLMPVLEEWSSLLNRYDVEFRSGSYESIRGIGKDDLVYMDPPYAGTKGMYFGRIDYASLWKWAAALPCDWMLSFDGEVHGASGVAVYDGGVPEGIYDEKVLLHSGNSSYRRLIRTSRDSNVMESLYIKRRNLGLTSTPECGTMPPYALPGGV